MIKTLVEISEARPLFPMAAIEVDGVLSECEGTELWSTNDVRNLMIAMWLRGFEWRGRVPS